MTENGNEHYSETVNAWHVVVLLAWVISNDTVRSVAVLRWSQGAQAPQILPRPPNFWTQLFCYWLN